MDGRALPLLGSVKVQPVDWTIPLDTTLRQSASQFTISKPSPFRPSEPSPLRLSEHLQFRPHET